VRRHHDHFGLGIELAQFDQDLQAVHALHYQVEQDDVGLVQEVALERDEAVFRLHDVVAFGLENLSERATRQRRIVDDEHSLCHTRSTMASVNRSSRTLSSLKPASTTARGIPYTTHVSSDSVKTEPPRALIHAAPWRP